MLLCRKTFYLNVEKCNETSFVDKFQVLRRHDSSIERVDAVYFSSTSPDRVTCLGYGESLGQALLHNANSMVSRLDLDPRTFFPNNDDDTKRRTEASKPMLQFIKSSQALRTLSLACADLDLRYFHDELFTSHVQTLSSRILVAAAANPHISTVIIKATIPAKSFAQLMATSKSIKNVVLAGSPFTEQVFSDLAGPQDVATMRGIFKAVRKVSKATEPAPMASSQVSAQRTLRIMYSGETKSLVRNLLRKLDNDQGNTANSQSAGSTTGSQQGWHVQVDLSYEMTNPAHFFRGAYTQSAALAAISLYQTEFDEPAWQSLVCGLQSSSVTLLSLKQCDFDENAARQCQQYIQTQANREGHDKVGELHMSMTATVGGSLSYSQVVSAVVNSESALHHFELDQIDGSEMHPSLTYRIVMSDSKEYLQHSWQNSSSWDIYGPVLALFFDKTTCTSQDMNALLSTWPGRLPDATQLTRALQQSGSLCFASVLDDGGTSDGLVLNTEDHLRQIQAYGQRNAMLPKLLATVTPKATGSSTRTGANDDCPTDATSSTLHRLELLAVARHAPRTAPNNTLLGLLSMSEDSIPARSDCIRKLQTAHDE